MARELRWTAKVCAYVTGHTDCGDYPTKKAYQGAIGGAFDAFVTKLTLKTDTTAAVDLLLLN